MHLSRRCGNTAGARRTGQATKITVRSRSHCQNSLQHTLSAPWSWVRRPPQAISELRPHEPAHLSVIGGVFLLESIARYAVLVRYSEFGGCPLFESSKCNASTGIAVSTSTVVCYSEEVRYWEGPLLGGSTVYSDTPG